MQFRTLAVGQTATSWQQCSGPLISDATAPGYLGVGAPHVLCSWSRVQPWQALPGPGPGFHTHCTAHIDAGPGEWRRQQRNIGA